MRKQAQVKVQMKIRNNPHYHYGDLVFYMPMPRDGRRAKDNIVGIAFVKNADIIALCPPSTWVRHVVAATF